VRIAARWVRSGAIGCDAGDTERGGELLRFVPFLPEIRKIVFRAALLARAERGASAAS
jgi:hypothetical protein